MTDNQDDKIKAVTRADSDAIPSDSSAANTAESIETESPKFIRYAIIAFGGLGGVIVLSLIIALILAATNGYGLADAFRVVRDFLIVILALQGIFISVALIVLVVQLASFLNLLRNEVKPLIDELRDTATAARGTARFVSRNVAAPMINTAAGITAVRAFVGQFFSIRRNSRRK